MKTKYLSYFVIIFPAIAQAQELSPREIFDQLISARKTLNFSTVSPYIHSQALSLYRKTTSAVIKHAVEKYGVDAVVEFFQGTTLAELKSFSDQEYWAFVMASSAQFSIDKPVPLTRPTAEIAEGNNRMLLVYRSSGCLATAPELGAFSTHVVYAFEQENRAWKMTSFASEAFEATLYWYLQGKRAEQSR